MAKNVRDSIDNVGGYKPKGGLGKGGKFVGSPTTLGDSRQAPSPLEAPGDHRLMSKQYSRQPNQDCSY